MGNAMVGGCSKPKKSNTVIRKYFHRYFSNLLDAFFLRLRELMRRVFIDECFELTGLTHAAKKCPLARKHRRCANRRLYFLTNL